MGKHKQRIAQRNQGASFIGFLAIVVGVALLYNFPNNETAVIAGMIVAGLGGLLIKFTV